MHVVGVFECADELRRSLVVCVEVVCVIVSVGGVNGGVVSDVVVITVENMQCSVLRWWCLFWVFILASGVLHGLSIEWTGGAVIDRGGLVIE